MCTTVSIPYILQTLVFPVIIVYQKRQLSYHYQFEFILHYAQELGVSCLCIVAEIGPTLGNDVLGLFRNFSRVFDTVKHGTKV